LKPTGLAGLLLIFALPALSQSFSPDLSRIPFYSIHVEDGLSNEAVYCLLQDKRGFVWIGTFGGLDRYDGKEVVSYKPGGTEGFSLSATVVFALAEGKAGTVWAGTDGGGLNRLDPENGRVDIFRGLEGGPDGLGSDLVYALAAERDGDLWIGTGGEGLALRKEADGRFAHFTVEAKDLPSNVVRSLLIDTGGRLWVGTASGGLVVTEDPGSERPEFKPVLLRGAGSFPTVRALYEDSVGRIWIGTEGNGLFMSDGNLSSAAKVRLPDGIGGDRAIVRAIGADAAGRLWVGTDGSGVAVLSGIGVPMIEFHSDPTEQSGISGDQVRAIMRDRSGLVWIGFKDRGISIGNPQAVVFGLHPVSGRRGELPRGMVRGFAEAGGGRLWIASDGGGLVRYDEGAGAYRVYGPEEGLANDRICAVLVSRGGTVYAGSDGGGLFSLEPGAAKLRPVPLDLSVGTGVSQEGGSVVWALLEDAAGNLWVGLEGAGLVKLPPDGTRIRYRYNPRSPLGLGGRSVRCLLEDHDGSILVGTWDGGLQRVDPVSGLVSRFPAFAEAGSSTSDVSIYTIFRDSSDRVWIGTGAGLDRMIREDSGDWITRVSLGALSRRPGVFGIAEDSGGFLWLSTEDGLLRYDPETGSVRSWTRGDGLQDDHFAPGAFLKLSDGRFAFGGVEGFNLFHPSTIDMSDAVPQVRIMSLVPLDGQGLTERSSAIPGDGSLLRVPYATSGFSLTLAVLDFTDPGKNVHAIRIEGPRDQRYHLGFSNTAIVPRLAPGKYRFIASGAGNRGVWNENGSSVTVEIVPPFWMRAQFFAVLGLFAAAGIFGAVRLRVSRLEHRTRELRELSAHIHDAREEERTEIAREVHDQLGQTLTAVKMGLYWAKENSRISAETMENRLGELLEYTDLALDSVKSISTRLRPKVLDTLPLDEALGWLIRDFSRWSGVECESRIDRIPFELDRRTKTTLFRVLQENLTNVARHSGASKVWITLVMNDDRIELTVRDNGHGIDADTPAAERSFGIAGMRERCSYLGGSFDIFPAQTGGTVMIARLPHRLSGDDEDA
jgi:signal transduction histidine kinase/ligand-binding sensor domain-containing protein